MKFLVVVTPPSIYHIDSFLTPYLFWFDNPIHSYKSSTLIHDIIPVSPLHQIHTNSAISSAFGGSSGNNYAYNWIGMEYFSVWYMRYGSILSLFSDYILNHVAIFGIIMNKNLVINFRRYLLANMNILWRYLCCISPTYFNIHCKFYLSKLCISCTWLLPKIKNSYIQLFHVYNFATETVSTKWNYFTAIWSLSITVT